MPFHKGEIERLRQQGVAETDLHELMDDVTGIETYVGKCNVSEAIEWYTALVQDVNEIPRHHQPTPGPAGYDAMVNLTRELWNLKAEALKYTVNGIETCILKKRPTHT